MQHEDVDADDGEEEDSSPRYYNFDDEMDDWMSSDTDEVSMYR